MVHGPLREQIHGAGNAVNAVDTDLQMENLLCARTLQSV